MLKLKVNKKFLDDYRNYKIDLLNGIVVKNIEYIALEHYLNNSKINIHNLYEELTGYKYIKINVVNLKIEKENIVDIINRNSTIEDWIDIL